MKIGIRFCGGCNPRYDRGKVAGELMKAFEGKVDFGIAEEGIPYDHLVVIGGCTNCCAGYDQFDNRGEVLKIWEPDHFEKTVSIIKGLLQS